jgi:hypothetical protein
VWSLNCRQTEYSIPLETINRCLSEGILPNENKLWILGLESISILELNTFKESHAENIEIIQPRQVDANLGNFLDPVIYIFRAKSIVNGSLKTVIAFQFKTYPMGGISFERDNLIKGNYIYILRANREHTVKIITLLCSDVLNNDLSIKDRVGNTLLIHLQLNTSPRHQSYSEYRRSIWNLASDCTEIISLNWAEKINFNQNEQSDNISGSCIYSKSKDIDLCDRRLRVNHRGGLYFTYESSYRVFHNYINYTPNLYLISNTKPSQIAGNVTQSGRHGPYLLKNFGWNSGESTWCEVIEEIPSGDLNEIHNFARVLELYNSINNDFLFFERILALTLGKGIKNKDWYSVKNLEFFNISQDEILRRTTFCQDKDTVSYSYRRDVYHKMNNILGALSRGIDVPRNMIGLIGSGRFSYNEENPHHNLYGQDGEKGTLVYLGEIAIDSVKQVYDQIYEILVDEKIDFKRLVIIFINENMELETYYNKSIEDVDFNEDDSSNSITRVE